MIPTILFIGFIVGLAIGTIIERVSRSSMLAYLAKMKSAEKIDGEFYYIVPEARFNELTSIEAQSKSKGDWPWTN